MLILLYFCSSRPALRSLVLPYSRFIQCFSFAMWAVACGSQQKEEPVAVKPSIEFAAELEPLVEAYIADAEAANSPVPTEFREELVQVVWEDDMGRDGDERVLGRCDRINENHQDLEQRFRTIRIQKPDDRGYIGPIKVDLLVLKAVVYHELGHCLHDYRGHLPESSHQLMSSALPTERFHEFSKLLSRHFSLVKKIKQN